MVIQHNIPALNSHRNLGINNNATAKNLEKLSSGYRINRAGDDAAGLAISEKMRGQIRGLAMAEQNASNGISLIQTAEGGLNETHAILQRMRELAVQSSNGTYQEDDRAQIQLEIDALKGEIDRIASSTHYNGINLLDGTMEAKELTSANVGSILGSSVTEANFTLSDAVMQDLGLNLEVGSTYDAKLIISDSTGDPTVALQVGSQTIMLSTTDNIAWTLTLSDGTTVAPILTLDDELDATNAVVSFSFEWDGTNGSKMVDGDNPANTVTDLVKAVGVTVATENDKLVFQIGANGTADQRVDLYVANMSTANLGGKDGLIANIDLTDRDLANAAIDVIDQAINQVSSQRASLGALQNRLEHTLNNLGVTKENLTAAESTIRDVDMAKEMMEFTKNNILVQASQAMLAQANALPQGVLSLLR